MSARGLWINSYYPNEDAVATALADALKEEYRAIVDSGFLIQLDDAFLAHEYDRLLGEMSQMDFTSTAKAASMFSTMRSRASRKTGSATTCVWGSWNAPHTTDVPLKTLVDLVLKVRAQAYSLEAANPRHEHEWQVWKDVKLPEGKILIPGVVTHSTNVVEHPGLVAWRIKNFCRVGRPRERDRRHRLRRAITWCVCIQACSGPSSNRWPREHGSHPRSCGPASTATTVARKPCHLSKTLFDVARGSSVGCWEPRVQSVFFMIC
jgi:hypothetical protein